MRPGIFALAALSALAALPAFAQDQTRTLVPLGTICPDGSNPGETGIGCAMPAFRNATDEGRNSTTLPRQQAPIVVPNDPLGNGIGNSDPGIGQLNGGFGNSGVNLPKIK